MDVRVTVGPLRLADCLVLVETNDEEFAATIRWCFRDLLADEGHGDLPILHRFEVARLEAPFSRWAILRDGEPCQLTLEEGYVLFHLQWEFNRVVLEQRTATVHAAAIEMNGRCILLTGSSMSGKTTLAGWMAARGAGYLCDEIISIDDRGCALHYRRPLGLRHGGPLEDFFAHPDGIDRRFDAYEMLVPVSALGNVTMPDDPIEIGAIVFPRYDPEASPHVEPIARSLAFQRLCENSPGLMRNGRPVFDLLSDLVHRVPVLQLSIRDSESAEQLLRSALSQCGVGS